MPTFARYARYYNLLYKDKDYVGEADYVDRLIQRHAPGAGSLVEFGCGTGNHAALLATRGYRVHGIDQSAGMLKEATARRRRLSREIARKLSFEPGDLRAARFSERFDAAISLFHVVSYQSTNADLRAAFATAKAALRPGGIFVFDAWYGPAVLTERPAVRVKRLEDDAIAVTRLAEPHLLPNENIVDVHYHVFVTEKSTGDVRELRETHRMRYLFKPELELLLSGAGLTLTHAEEWLTGRPLGADTWGACFIAQA